MSLSSLPLQVRVGIRDHWDNKDAEVNKALNNLNQTVGYDMTLEIAWVDVWNELQDKFTDKTTFVAAISDAIKKYLIRIEKLLEDSEEFQNNYLEMMEAKRKALFIQIHDDSVPQTKFVNNLFTLFLPKGDSSTYRTITDRLGADLEDVFSGKVTSAPKAEPFQTMKDDFVEVLPSGATPSLPKVTSLPLVSNLPKPEALFPTLLPYTLIVRRTGNGIDIEGSHEPTLSLICEYFKRHSRKNLNLTTQSPYFSVELVPSFWGTGTFNDVVRIARTDNRATYHVLETTAVLAFVEGICGYTLLKTEGSEWIFRRTEPFH